MTIEKPKWYSNLQIWREENGCTGELWDIYAEVTKEKVKQAAISFFGSGIAMGIIISYLYVLLR